MKVAVIGSGTMGNGIAHSFAQFGNQVALIDVSQDALKRSVKTIGENLQRQVDKATITAAQKASALENIKVFTNLENTVDDVELVIEAATEDTGIKLGIFRDLDQLCKPNTILASNTSSISITQIASATQRPDKVIGMHFMNPVPLMKLVEVIKGRDTSAITTETIMNIARQLNKTPVEVNDAPGFVANRILMPMINEAIYTLHEGIGGVEEIDTVMKLGMAHPMGPLQLADYIGLDVCLAILNVMEAGFDNEKYAACPLLKDMVYNGQKGIKTGLGFYNYNNHTQSLIVADRFKK